LGGRFGAGAVSSCVQAMVRDDPGNLPAEAQERRRQGNGVVKTPDVAKIGFVPREVDAPYQIWGDNLEATAVQQLKNACKLPVAVSGALMPDAHVGYGLPI